MHHRRSVQVAGEDGECAAGLSKCVSSGLRMRTPSPQRGEGWGEGAPTERLYPLTPRSPPRGEGEEAARTLSFLGYSLIGHRVQRRAVELVGRGERQFVDEPDEARVLIGRRVGEREALDRLAVERAAGFA